MNWKAEKEAAAGWYGTSWSRRIACWQNSAKVSGTEDHLNFPMHFTWTSDQLKTARDDAFDILFTDGDGTTKLSHEIREWSPSRGYIHAVVKLPQISPKQDTLFFVYFGNPTSQDQQHREGLWSDYEFVGAPVKIAEHSLSTLDALLSHIGLENIRRRYPSHPAVVRHDALSTLISGVPFNAEDWRPKSADIGKSLLDSLSVQLMRSDNVWEHVADDEALRQMRSRLQDPESFQDQYCEVICWSMLNALGVSARIIERDSLPDLQVYAPINSWVEVKRIRPGTNPQRARRVLGKANRQLRSGDMDKSGIAYLDVSRPLAARELSDEIPAEVEKYSAEIRRELGSGHVKHIARVFLTWDDMVTLGEPPELTKVVLRRRSLVFENRYATNPSELLKGASLGRTVDFYLTWK